MNALWTVGTNLVVLTLALSGVIFNFRSERRARKLRSEALAARDEALAAREEAVCRLKEVVAMHENCCARRN